MSQPTLALIISDWLPANGWGTLYVENLDGLSTIRCNKPIGPHNRQRKAHEKVATIYNDYVSFDYYRDSLPAANPDFFEDLDQILVASVFSGHQWWQRKVGWSFRSS
jgi:hypothetical protein